MALTIGQTAQQIHESLSDYIESAYHVSDSTLVGQRKQILSASGVIHQRPYLESTPRYQTGTRFGDLGLDKAVIEIFSTVFEPDTDAGVARLIHDPPYQHQAESAKLTLVDNRSIVVMTGTGSGKTECFLLPILGKLASEAHGKGTEFGNASAMRAMVLYPMNALVNDQLGRLRLLFGDPRIVSKFKQWSGRPARFARYTSRTLYPGVRDVQKDQSRLRPIRDYYVGNLELAQSADSSHIDAERLVHELKQRGKWPAKPDLIRWYGRSGTQWKNANGEFQRCVTLPDDAELLTRHEVQAAPPDVLVTNYSMLEYMLMRPLERPIFDQTRDWLEKNPEERFLLVIDEAHLYRGASGTEVALLIRRLTRRLGIGPERLQVICTSASLADADSAVYFAAQLAGKTTDDFDIVQGTLALHPNEEKGTIQDANALSEIDLEVFYEAETDDIRLSHVAKFLEYRQIEDPWELQNSLYDALCSFGPMRKLINLTMKEALPVDEIGETLFHDLTPDIAERAVTNLIALGSMAKQDPDGPSLLPCRVHSFYRGLPGLWVCMDSECDMLPIEQHGGPAGQLFSQPRYMCECGARVQELYTCRNCGTAYARAYTDDIVDPDFLWSEPGAAFRTLTSHYDELAPIDLLLEEPNPAFRERVEPAEYDIVTGRLNPYRIGERNRQVYLRKDREDPSSAEDAAADDTNLGEFNPCAVCGGRAAFGRSSIQDHQTKGDQPFQALVTKQIQVQPPSRVQATRFAPLRGRKVLVFSDSRQTAARLAPNIQTYSTQDALRPLMVSGYGRLTKSPLTSNLASLEDLYFAVLIAANELGVRIYPEIRSDESFYRANNEVRSAISDGKGALGDPDLINLLVRMRSEVPPESLLRGIVNSLTDRYFGLESLALASATETARHTSNITALPEIPGIAQSDDEKLALARLWIRCWNRRGIWFSRMPSSWWSKDIQSHSGRFADIRRFLSESSAHNLFNRKWLPQLLEFFTEPVSQNQYRIRGTELSLEIGGGWSYCQSCRTTQRPFPNRTVCVNCGSDTVQPIDPNNDPVFVARKGYYRASTLQALGNPPTPPMALIAAEHTAQLNTAQENEVFSKAEEYELLFQDVHLGMQGTTQERPAIDVLSCTTTMEVGIDIGALSGVSLRNMPPSRANYQQRSGRAGRRGDAIATVTAFGSADSHDEHYFTHPDQMIRGPNDTPTLTLDNPVIARRHITAFLLQRYHSDKLPEIEPEAQPHLFAVLGTVTDFQNPASELNRADLETWLLLNEDELKCETNEWLPVEIDDQERLRLLNSLVLETLQLIDEAIEYAPGQQVDAIPQGNLEDSSALEVQDELDEERPSQNKASENLLDRLLYKGVLPRFAFPTDVASFHVFSQNESAYRPVFQYTPSQGLPVALSQYAPGKEVWIDGKLWTSGAIYSPMPNDRYHAWENRRIYYDCKVCHYADTRYLTNGERGETRDCVACGGSETFGPGMFWMKPPGFAHPVNKSEGTSPDDQPARSYATRAKLTMPTPSEQANWTSLNDSVRVHSTRQLLLVTNRGPREEGYTYCTTCGLIEPTTLPSGHVNESHQKPYPTRQNDRICQGERITRGLVLGTDFISDVLLVSIRVNLPLNLRPGLLSTDVALRTVSEALTKAACAKLDIDSSELQAEYRPALTAAGQEGREAEIYLYDTLPGGAGFAQSVATLGLSVFEDALQTLEVCPEDCDKSCYRCLRSYKNKFEHHLLDRHVGASLLRSIVHGNPPTIDPSRLANSTNLLFEDLSRQSIEGLILRRNHSVDVPGLGTAVAPIYARNASGQEFIIGLHGALTPDYTPDDQLQEIKEFCPSIPVLLRDELAVHLNLPSTTKGIMDEL